MAGPSMPGAEIDAALPTKINVQPTNYLDTAVKLQGLQQGVLSNKLLGQQVEGKIAMGEAASAAIDPETGKFDGDKFLKLLSQDKRGAFQVPEAAAQAVARNIQEKQLDQQTLALTSARMAKVGDVVASVLSTNRGADGKPQPLTRDGVIRALSDGLVSTGLLNDQDSIRQLAGVVATLPTDERQLRDRLAQLYLQSHATQEGIAMVKGTPSTVDTGSQIIQQQVAPLTGDIQVNGVVNKTRSPSEKAQQVQVWDAAKGQYVLKPSGEAMGDMAPGTLPGAPQTPLAAGPAIGTQETATSNVEQAQALQKRAAIVPNRKAALANLVNTLDKFTPGPKANLTGSLQGLAAQFGLAPPAVAEGKAAQDEFNKLAAQIALDQWGALGGSGSNAQLETAVHANPNEVMSKMGIKNVAALLQGNEDAIGAQFDAWQKYSAKHGPASYGEFLGGWNKYYDPRVFQAEHMAPAAVKSMLGKMTDAERKTFLRDQSIARQAGWIGGQ
jgi:hypothetical protein